MRKNSIVILMLLVTKGLLAQNETEADSLNKLHFIYVVPTSLVGSLGLDLDNFWAEIGYGYKYKKSMYSFSFGAIVNSQPNSGGALIWGGISQLRSNGFNTSFEYKRILVKRFYFATQLYLQHTGTIREETYFLNATNPQARSQYSVSRNEIGLIPKVGFLFATKGRLSCDIGLGAGVRYISSKFSGKKNLSGNNQKELLTNKTFDSGQKIAQRIALQFRIGYSF